MERGQGKELNWDKLANENFVARAPEDVVEEQRERRAEAADAKAKLELALQRLNAA